MRYRTLFNSGLYLQPFTGLGVQEKYERPEVVDKQDVAVANLASILAC